MPKYNQRGDILFGRDKYAGLIKRGEKAVILGNNCNAPCFITDDKIAAQGNAFSGQTYLQFFNPNSKGENASIVALTGGAGKYAYFNNQDLILSDGTERKGKGKASIGYDGTLIYSTFQGYKGLTVESGGLTHEWPDIPVNETFCYNFVDYVAFNATNKVWYCIGETTSREVTLPSVAIRGTIAIINAIPYLIYSGQEGTYIVNLIYHLTDKPKYYKTGTKQYNPDVIKLDDKILITYSLTAGEREADIIEADITSFFNQIEGAPQDKPAEDKPVEEPKEEFKVKAIKAFNRRLIFAPYKSFEAQYGVTKDFLGNVAFCETVEATENSLKYVPVLICALAAWTKDNDNRTLAFYIHCSSGSLEQCRVFYEQALEKSEKPIILYKDARDWPKILPTWINQDRTWIGFQFYRDYNDKTKEVESILNFELNIEAALDTVSDYKLPIVLTTQCYDRSVMIENQVVEIQPFIERAIRENELIIGEMPFSELRPGGFEFLPKVKAYIEARFNAVFERPNRYDYWKSKEWKKNLKEKLDYSSLTLLKWEKEYLKGKI